VKYPASSIALSVSVAEPHNFGSENNVSTYEVVKYILQLLEIENPKLIPNEVAFAEQPKNLYMNIDKLKKRYPDGFKAEKSKMRESDDI